jgi:ERCC4-type nuclease
MKPAALHILVDTREQTPPPFPDGVTTERATLPEGDYTTAALRGIAAIERKNGSDYASSLGRERERVDREIQRLQPYRFKCIVVEDDLSSIYRGTAMHPHSILGSICSMYARFDVPTLFVGNPAAAGRVIAGLLRRWGDRVASEGGQAA